MNAVSQILYSCTFIVLSFSLLCLLPIALLYPKLFVYIVGNVDGFA